MTKFTMTIDKEDTKRWRNESGQLHREDGPAVEWSDGWKMWYQDGQRHCIDGPAIRCDDGDVTWYIRGKYLGINLKGFWALWELLNEEERQNVNLHMWLRKLTND